MAEYQVRQENKKTKYQCAATTLVGFFYILRKYNVAVMEWEVIKNIYWTYIENQWTKEKLKR